MGLTRRGFVRWSALMVGLSAGCLGMGGVPDLSVYNWSDSEVTVKVAAVWIENDETLLEDTVTLAPNGESGDSKNYQELVDGSETARINIDVRDGPAGAYEFSDETNTDARGVHARVRPETVEFQEVVA